VDGESRRHGRGAAQAFVNEDDPDRHRDPFEALRFTIYESGWTETQLPSQAIRILA
jgi:hypothetical protein